MEKYDGLKLKSLFYSEISSSSMVSEIFQYHKIIAKEFIKNLFNLNVDNDISIVNEKRYVTGSVDLFLSFDSNDIKTNILIEIKVHDYISVKPAQIKTYYEAAQEELDSSNVYFIYLTQFNRKNFTSELKATLPNSIKEFDDSLKIIPESRLKHLNWEEFHDFIEPYKKKLPKEYILILELHKTWITAQSKEDIESNIIGVGERGLSNYFSDINIDIEKELPFGNTQYRDKKEILTVDLIQCNTDQLNKILNVIKIFADSNNVYKKVKQVTREDTLLGAKEFLKSLSENDENWHLLSFYSSLFNLVNSTDYLLLHGTGTKGFSIKVNIKRKGSISMCTLWANKKIDFSIKR